MRILTSTYGTDRNADIIHIGLTVTVWEWLTAGLVSFFLYGCLELLLMQSRQNNG